MGRRRRARRAQLRDRGHPRRISSTSPTIRSNPTSSKTISRVCRQPRKAQNPSTTPIRPRSGVQRQRAAVVQRAEANGVGRPEEFTQGRGVLFHPRSPASLTSWLPAPGPFQYDVTAALNNFGKCALPDDKLKYRNPGSCVAGGGRTGYSVKIVGRDALLASVTRWAGVPAAERCRIRRRVRAGRLEVELLFVIAEQFGHERRDRRPRADDDRRAHDVDGLARAGRQIAGRLIGVTTTAKRLRRCDPRASRGAWEPRISR